MKKRKNISHLEERYSIINGERDTLYYKCVYCGDPADCRDHVPPLSRVDDYHAIGLIREQYIKVPCCAECNRLASDSLQDNILDRVEHIKNKLARKYVRRLHTEWDLDELDELGPNLRSAILHNSKKIKRATIHINYYAGIDAVLDQLS